MHNRYGILKLDLIAVNEYKFFDKNKTAVIQSFEVPLPYLLNFAGDTQRLSFCIEDFKKLGFKQTQTPLIYK